MDLSTYAAAKALISATKVELTEEIRGYIGTGITNISIEEGSNDTEVLLKFELSNGTIVKKVITGILTQDQKDAIIALLDYIGSKKVLTEDDVYSLPIATKEALGGVKIDDNTIVINNGVISVDASKIVPEEVQKSLQDLSDISLEMLAGRDVLVYDSELSKFKNVPFEDVAIDKNKKFQFNEMPEANEHSMGNIIQYVGTTNDNYTKGYFYICQESDNVYFWVNLEVNKVSPDEIWIGTEQELAELSSQDKDKYSLFLTVDTEVQGNSYSEEFESSSIWEISHNLNSNVKILTLDSDGEQIIGHEEINSFNKVTITFCKDVAGKAYVFKL